MDSLGRITAVLLAVILLFLFPLRYDAFTQNQARQEAIFEEVVHLVETIKVERRVTKQQYQYFCESMVGMLNKCTVELYSYEEYLYTQGETTGHLLYKDIASALIEDDYVSLEKGNYITVRVRQTEEGIIERLQSLIIPIGIQNNEYVFGGRIE